MINLTHLLTAHMLFNAPGCTLDQGISKPQCCMTSLHMIE